MNGYLLGIIGTVLFSSVLTAIVPEGKTSGIIKGVAKLACVIAIVSPVLHFFKTRELGEGFFQENFSKSVIQTDEEYIQYYSEMRIRETENALEKELEENFAIHAEIRIDWALKADMVGSLYEADVIKINRIFVQTDGKQNEEVVNSVWEYLTKNYCSEVLIE